MNVVALLVELEQRGIQLELSGDRLRYFPRCALTEDILDELREHKPALLAILNGETMVTRETRNDAHWEMVQRVNARYRDTKINWPMIDSSEKRIKAAVTFSELVKAIVDYERVALGKSVKPSPTLAIPA